MVPFKKTLLAAALVAAAPLAMAADQQTGGFDMYLSGGVGYSQFSEDELDDMNAELRASVAYTDKSGIGFQLDNVYSRQYLGDVFDYASTYDIAGHLYYRNSGWQAGAFYQHRSFDYESGIDPSVDASLDASVDNQHFYGIEGQGFFGNLTVGGQLGQHKMGFASGTIEDTGTFAGLHARYFMNDNWRLDANYLYDKVDIEGIDFEVNQFGIGTEYRLNSSPLSMFAKYSRTNSEVETPGGSNDIDEDRIMVGVKLNFGKGTLRQQDRDGASLNPVPGHGLSALPMF